MNPMRQALHRHLAEALGCASDEEYHRKTEALLKYLRRIQPQYFHLEGGRKRSFEGMARMEHMTVEEKLEDLALTGFLVQREFLKTKKEDALAAIAECGLPEEEVAILEKVVQDLFRNE